MHYVHMYKANNDVLLYLLTSQIIVNALLTRSRHMALYECVLIDWLIDSYTFLRFDKL